MPEVAMHRMLWVYRTEALPVSLQQHGRAQVLVLIPPVGWAGGGAAGAEDALVQAIDLVPVRLALVVLCAVPAPRQQATSEWSLALQMGQACSS